MTQKNFEYEVALSFAGEDREYVQHVAAELKRCQVAVFYDAYEKASLWGKDLYGHLQSVYAQKARFTVIFVSRAYATKLWTNHELKAAQSRALKENQEYLLPARFDQTEIPGLLDTTAYVDLREKSPEEFAALIVEKVRGGQQIADVSSESSTPGSKSKSAPDRNPLLVAAELQFAERGTLSNAVCDAILELEAAPDGLLELLIHIVGNSQSVVLQSLTTYAVDCIEKFDVGYEAVELSVRSGRLEEAGLGSVGAHLSGVTREQTIRWAHDILVRQIRNDFSYCIFFIKHRKFLLSTLPAAVAAYLLHPDRGPSNNNVDTLFVAATHSERPKAFVRRLCEWVRSGKFDHQHELFVLGSHRPPLDTYVLYRYLNRVTELSENHPLHEVSEAVIDKVRDCMRDADQVRVALYHLFLMRLDNFNGLAAVVDRLPEYHGKDPLVSELFFQLRSGIGFEAHGRSMLLAEQLGVF